MSCEWLTVTQAAKFVQVHEQTIHAWIRKGWLTKWATPGRGTRVCKGELLKPHRKVPDSNTGNSRVPSIYW